MARVTGIGGVFFLANGNNEVLAEWYQRCLGFEIESFGGSVLQWKDDHADDEGTTVWHIAAQDSEWFKPSTAKFMINYRIDDMEGMLARLQNENVDIISGPETHENGKFVWIMDPQGNKVELWEPKIWEDIVEQPN